MYSVYSESPSTPSRSSSTSAHSHHSAGWNGYNRTSMQGDVPKTVHSLLASTKRLQEVLEEWSNGQASETEVSDVYVQIGTEFNATIAAFAYHQIDLSDLHPVPQEMRTVLEHCLADDPTPDTLARYMPQLKAVLIKLLRGLQTRQDTWQSRSMMSHSNGASPRNSR